MSRVRGDGRGCVGTRGRAHAPDDGALDNDHLTNLVGLEVAQRCEPVCLVVAVVHAHVQPARGEPRRGVRRVGMRCRAEEQQLLVREICEAVKHKLRAQLEEEFRA